MATSYTPTFSQLVVENAPTRVALYKRTVVMTQNDGVLADNNYTFVAPNLRRFFRDPRVLARLVTVNGNPGDLHIRARFASDLYYSSSSLVLADFKLTDLQPPATGTYQLIKQLVGLFDASAIQISPYGITGLFDGSNNVLVNIIIEAELVCQVLNPAVTV